MNRIRKSGSLTAPCRDRKTPLGECCRKSAVEIIKTHLENCREHFADEKANRANVIMQGGRTVYGSWWAGKRNSNKRPFYEFEPSQVAEAIESLNKSEVVQLYAELREIAIREVAEFEPAATAAEKQIARIR